jgi:Metallo-beta-lactamase superfamily
VSTTRIRPSLVALALLGLAAGASAQPPNVPDDHQLSERFVDRPVRLARHRVPRHRDGIVLADPLGVKAATWLRDELAVRFPGRPVRWIVHTHHHFDRAAGAAGFSDTAQTVAHREFNRQLERTRSSAGFADVRPALRSFDARDRILLGGRTVDVIYTDRGHSPDMSVLHFSGERVVFAADHPDVAAVPFTFGISSAHQVAEWLAAVAPLDFDVMLSGEGERSRRRRFAC